ncbi:hypothetical protein GCM10027614_81100 [Micromonospora vulcania]
MIQVTRGELSPASHVRYTGQLSRSARENDAISSQDVGAGTAGAGRLGGGSGRFTGLGPAARREAGDNTHGRRQTPDGHPGHRRHRPRQHGGRPDGGERRAGQGTEKIPFITHSAGKDVRVIPADAVGLLNRGKLDSRLFDISTLVAFGYDDTRATLPLIVQHGGAAPAGLAGARTTRALTGASAVAENRSDAVSFWNSITSATKGTERQLRSGFDKIWLDGLRRPTLDVSVPLTGAPEAWQAGWTGAG